MQWCWRCKMDMPMLDEDEFALVMFELQASRPDGRQAMLAEYNRLTGLSETNPNAVYHHRISIYGPPCPHCRKVLRTPLAFKCFECGHVSNARPCPSPDSPTT